MPKAQMITRRVKADSLFWTGKYYAQVRKDICKKIATGADFVIINLEPKTPINEKYILESCFYMQGEFTSFITIPPTTVDYTKTDADGLKLLLGDVNFAVSRLHNKALFDAIWNNHILTKDSYKYMN